MQCPSRTLDDDWRRRADTNDYLRVCRAHAQRDPAYRDEQAILQRHQNLRDCQLATTAYTKRRCKATTMIAGHGQHCRHSMSERQAKAYDQLTDVISERPRIL
jgi:hypothetical protein